MFFLTFKTTIQISFINSFQFEVVFSGKLGFELNRFAKYSIEKKKH